MPLEPGFDTDHDPRGFAAGYESKPLFEAAAVHDEQPRRHWRPAEDWHVRRVAPLAKAVGRRPAGGVVATHGPVTDNAKVSAFAPSHESMTKQAGVPTLPLRVAAYRELGGTHCVRGLTAIADGVEALVKREVKSVLERQVRRAGVTSDTPYASLGTPFADERVVRHLMRKMTELTREDRFRCGKPG